MTRAELAEIRARLRAATEGEERPRRPLLAPLRAILAPAPQAAPQRPNLPPPRRVGLRPTAIPDEAMEALLVPREAEDAPRRNAFGQRTEPADPEAPLQLTRLALPAPTPALEIDRSDLEFAVRRLNSVLAKPAAQPAETPYYAEDFDDHHPDGQTERLYAAAGLAELDPPVRLRRKRIERPEPPAPPPAPATAEEELLGHLMRVFLAEQAGVDALRLH